MFDYKVGAKPPSKNMPNSTKQIKIFSTTRPIPDTDKKRIYNEPPSNTL